MQGKAKGLFWETIRSLVAHFFFNLFYINTAAVQPSAHKLIDQYA